VLPPRHRINSGDDFRRVLRRGHKHSSDLGVIAVVPSEAGPRLGVIVSKAVGGAVVRNLVKRRIRAAFIDLLSEVGTHDVVVRAIPGADNVSFSQIKSSLESALSAKRGS
jgi:ribonuclease P protein component